MKKVNTDIPVKELGDFINNIDKEIIESNYEKIIKNKYIKNHVSTLYYNTKSTKWESLNINPSKIYLSGQNNNIKNLTFLTYNIWFDKQNHIERYKTILKMLEDSKTDFICLQEVILDFYELLIENNFIKKTYYISGNKINSSYYVLMLSKFPVNFYDFKFKKTFMNRTLLIAETYFNKQKFLISTVHLESLNHSTQRRKEQLKFSFDILKESENSILMGDFNFDPKSSEEKNIDLNYKDLWRNLDLNFTMPKNSFFNSWRPDRIILKSNYWEGNKCFCVGRFCIERYFGNNFLEIEKDGVVRTPSDHFGIIGNIFLNEERFLEFNNKKGYCDIF